MSPDAASAVTDRLVGLVGSAPAVGGRSGVRIEARAPGRVNLIGEHTDYSGGLALPMAIDLGTTVHGYVGGDDVVLDSDDLPGEVALRNVSAGGVGDPSSVEPMWGRYVAGVVDQVAGTGRCWGVHGRVSTTLPVGAGLSSSAALELAVALAAGFRGTTRQLAELCQSAEHLASGVPCGVMDQLASACGVEGHALVVDFTEMTVTPLHLPDGLDIVVQHSGEPRTLVGSAYAERRTQCEAATATIGNLGRATPDRLAELTDPVVRRRARHVVQENERVRAMVDAIGAGDLRLAGRLLGESHRSLAEDFEVSTPGLDTLVDHLTALPGVFGARLTGAGFGGCVVAFCEPGALPPQADRWIVQPAGGADVRVVTDD